MSTNMTKEQLQAMTQVVSRQTFNNKVTEAIVGFIGGNLQSSDKIVVNKYYPGDDGDLNVNMNVCVPKLNVISDEISQLLDMGMSVMLEKDIDGYNIDIEAGITCWVSDDQQGPLELLNETLGNYDSVKSLITKLWGLGVYSCIHPVPDTQDKYLELNWMTRVKQQRRYSMQYLFNNAVIKL